MLIHTKKSGETLNEISREYGIATAKLAEINGITHPERLPDGKEILVAVPTKTYTVQRGDTPEEIAKRFGIGYEALLRNNPHLAECGKSYPEEILAIKYAEPIYGMGISNGYCYGGCSEKRFRRALYYAHFVTLSSFVRRGERVMRIFDDTAPIKAALEMKRIPLMRVYDGEGGTITDDYVTELLEKLKSGGYGGLTLTAHRFKREDLAMLLKLKRELMRCDKLLFCEIDLNHTNPNLYELDEISDALVLMYQKSHMKNTLSFDAGERRSFSEFAERANAQKAFMDMDEAIFMGDREIGRRNAEELAYRAKKAIIHDDESLTCGYKCKIYGLTKKREIEIRYESMKNEKARLDLLWELGFMGISFNINRLENSLIMMWSLLFSRGENIFI